METEPGHADHAHFHAKRQDDRGAAASRTARPVGPGESRRVRKQPMPHRRLLRAIRSRSQAVIGSMPSTITRAKSGHQVFTWRLNSRQALVTRALALGVLEAGKTPDVIGKPGRGQFRTWKSLTAAVERAERKAYVDETVAYVEANIPQMRDALTEAGVLGPAK